MVELAEMSSLKLYWQEKYPQAFCWSFGDSPTLADELAALVVAGKSVAPVARWLAIRKSSPLSRPGHITLCSTAQATPCASYARWRSG
ncbi:ASCH protein [Salmonella enterica subsp. enterica]|uniref:ASCH protein n=1 Tax=Salmonella enterica I TaxID=59201 RepID=A0A3S4GR27_SALET|nr:ASCH protein [Salmonella enterica subsp. enterica]